MNATRYEITVRGRLGDALLAAFEGVTLTSSADGTVLTSDVGDQAALYGVLDRIDALGLELVAVRRIAPAG